MPINNEAHTGPSATATPNSSGSIVRTPSYLGSGLKIKGQITGDEDLKIDGQIEGPISLGDHRLTVGQTAQVHGEISAREIMIYGDVRGNLLAYDRIEIKKDASVVGELTTSRIIIEDGAYVKAGIEIERSDAQVGVDADTDLALAEKNLKMKSIRSAGSGQ